MDIGADSLAVLLFSSCDSCFVNVLELMTLSLAPSLCSVDLEEKRVFTYV